MSNKNNKNILYCSFCGKSQHEVKKLIAGPTVFICDECIELCADITDYTPWKYYLSRIKNKLIMKKRQFYHEVRFANLSKFFKNFTSNT